MSKSLGEGHYIKIDKKFQHNSKENEHIISVYFANISQCGCNDLGKILEMVKEVSHLKIVVKL